jgi:hypothetical protein
MFVVASLTMTIADVGVSRVNPCRSGSSAVPHAFGHSASMALIQSSTRA